MPSIEDMYNEDFGREEYEDAKQILWEKHCEYPHRYSWPPTLEDVKQEIESAKWRDVGNR